MTDIPSKYDPGKTEDKWYRFWLDNKLFRSVPDQRKPYTIVIPPPNVTGVLHMGHMLNNTIQDILIRRARMMGFNALWVPGTDHASIATEARVVAKLKERGIEKKDLSREEFLKYAWDWKNKHGGIILEQLKKLGASCDWERTRFTMDDEMSETVIKVFVDLYRKGKIYRGIRMVNWDPKAGTAVSDEEVIYREVKSKLYYINYRIDGEDGFVTIATTRPETILGDTAVCINPKDKRYHYLKGKKVYVPMVNRLVPIIEDDYVDIEFGTGCLKITPAHDVNDYEIGIRHNLESIDIFNNDGTISQEAQLFTGVDRFVARGLAVKQLEEEGLLVRVEDYVNKIGYSERTDVVIEPKLSMQWFVKMKELAKPALDNVMNGNIRLIPSKFINTYKHWMENVKDWCVSRQLWWGHRIPAYYIYNSNEFVVAESVEEALQLAKEKTGNNDLGISDLTQDEDVLDTWFSSWLWPISVFDGIRNPQNEDIQYYYPTDDLITAPEILFFWVARMIIAGYEYMNEKPFKNVYLTGLVRDAKRVKMSKSLGNSPDPIELINNFSADGVRVGMLLCSPAGNDLLFDESLPEQGRNFANKIWNAFRLVKSWKRESSASQPEYARQAVTWFCERLKQGISEVDLCFRQYRISDALMQLYRLFWDDFSSFYLEIIKPEYGTPIDKDTLGSTVDIFENLLKLLHPFMPFITEEIWHLIKPGSAHESIMTTRMPVFKTYDREILEMFDNTREIIGFIRNTRANNQISNKEKLSLSINSKIYRNNFDPVIIKLGNLSSINMIDHKPVGVVSLITKTGEYYINPGDMINHHEEIKKLEAELEYTKGFLESVMKKLKNERFISGAPAKVLETEKKKKEDAETKIRGLEERLVMLRKDNAVN
jgi:valyl-tRNA synthetase